MKPPPHTRVKNRAVTSPHTRPFPPFSLVKAGRSHPHRPGPTTLGPEVRRAAGACPRVGRGTRRQPAPALSPRRPAARRSRAAPRDHGVECPPYRAPGEHRPHHVEDRDDHPQPEQGDHGVAQREQRQRERRRARRDELRQHRQVEHERLRVGDVRQEALPQAAAGRGRAAGEPRVVPAERRAQRLHPQVAEVGHARPPDRLEHRLQLRDQDAEAGGGRRALDRAGQAHPGRAPGAAPPPARQRVLHHHGEVGPGQQREHRREREERAVGRPVHPSQARREGRGGVRPAVRPAARGPARPRRGPRSPRTGRAGPGSGRSCA